MGSRRERDGALEISERGGPSGPEQIILTRAGWRKGKGPRRSHEGSSDKRSKEAKDAP